MIGKFCDLLVSTKTLKLTIEFSLRNDYGFCLWMYLPGWWMHNQNYEN